MLPSETCDSFTNLDTCFTVFIIFKTLSVLLNLSSMVGLVYLIRKRQFELYDVSVMTQSRWALRIGIMLAFFGLL